MKILSIGLDRAAAEPGSRVAQRQAGYFSGWQADIVILATGKARVVELTPGVTAHLTGGGSKPMALWRGYRLARKLAQAAKPDVVMTQDALWCGLIGRRVAQSCRVPLQVQDHGAYFARTASSFSEKILAPWAKRVVRDAKRVRTVGPRGAQGLRRIGVPEDRIDIIPIATDARRFMEVGEPSGNANVLCIARLEPEKGVDVLLEAWKRVKEKSQEAKLRIVGEGSRGKALEAAVRESGLEGSVEFVGKSAEVEEHLAWAAIYVQPSWFEGWGLAVVEAAAAGRPVAMTETGCAGIVIRDGESGFLCRPGDSEGLAKGIVKLLEAPDMARTMGMKAREGARTLATPEATVGQLRASLEKCLV